MDVFEFRESLIGQYQKFTRSFVSPSADDIKAYMEQQYDNETYWPSPYLQLNPSFVAGRSIEQHVADGTLHKKCSNIFRTARNTPHERSLTLFSHQEKAVAAAAAKRSYVVSTGTGSGKSLAFFIPIVDAVLKAKDQESTPRTRALVIYPMNALANSQLEELNEFLGAAGKPVTYGRYTGQESESEKLGMAQNPPDILLTNFMMLELLMTRQDSDKDIKIMEHCRGLDFLVLDELHTYRGRQGADVAVLVRRVRESLNPDLLTIGTSATMASEGVRSDRATVVAAVASKLFGAPVRPDDVIGEDLQLKTAGTAGWTSENLALKIKMGVPADIGFEELKIHPVACWIETKLGLREEEGVWIRNRPLQLNDAATRLHNETGCDFKDCFNYLRSFLLLSYRTRNAEGQPFFAYRLHQFISGPGTLYATLERPGERSFDLSGQVFLPGSNRSKRLFDTHFCRSCGKEFHPVWEQQGPQRFEPRRIEEHGLDESENNDAYLMPDPDFQVNQILLNENIPELWFNPDKPGEIKSNYRKHLPEEIFVGTDGLVDEKGIRFLFIRGTFRFCPACGIHYSRGKDALKLPGFSGEGRSSATTIISLNTLRYLLNRDVELSDAARKLLGFTDNRQDASLQAGHFNDFMQVLLMRSALLAAIEESSDKYLREDTFADAVFRALRFNSDDPAIRAEYLQDPHVEGGVNKRRAEEAIRRVLGYRLYVDLKRGWRYNNPNLEQLGLLKIDYDELDDLCNDRHWVTAHPLLSTAAPQVRKRVLQLIFDDMRRKLCIQTSHLSDVNKEQIRNQSSSYLREPWGITEDREIADAHVMLIGTRTKKNAGKGDGIEILSIRSKVGYELKRPSLWERPDLKFTTEEFNRVVHDLVSISAKQGYLFEIEVEKGVVGYQLKGDLLLWRKVDSEPAGQEDGAEKDRYAISNSFFKNLYLDVAQYLKDGVTLFHSLHAHEHTAQVESDKREEREEKFRNGDLRILYCSPTMELGVNISTLNTVYMRNVPPTPANYAQRSGRAGRSGQPALVITYCAAQSPHDQYFFADPVRMIHGEVTPPALDLCNDDLLSSHIHAVWLAVTRVKLPSTINEMLDMNTPDTMPLLEYFQEALGKDDYRKKTLQRARTILSMIDPGEFERAKGLWLDAGRELPEALDQWLVSILHRTYRQFDESLRRWREIFKATRRQMDETRRIMDNPAATERERTAAKRRHDEAFNQQKLLLETRALVNSDFSTYRYLAGEGFLPGYNFPRLPVSAYIPAQSNRKKYDSYLCRPRFLAISEFGPNSLIYHEGAQYRVRQVILTASRSDHSMENTLPVEVVTICNTCGYGHFGEQKADEFCALCNASLSDAVNISNLYRIENVSTRKADRITCDEEERMRQGYDVRTTVQFVRREGRINRRVTTIDLDGDDLVELQYGPTATVRRLNLGWKRRKEKTVFGFNINTATGFWSKKEVENDGVDMGRDEDDGREQLFQRISPYAEDRRNVLLIRVKNRMEPEMLTTLQYALKRSIESLYQLEESELMAEPMPSREDRKAILFYEAAEGGAGVLTRLALDSQAMGEVARRALTLMHYTLPEDGSTPSVDELLQQNRSNTICEMGCYKCLLSYYNQPEHTNIDRTFPQVLAILLQMIKAEVKVGSQMSREAHYAELLTLSSSALEREWLSTIYKRGYILPDRAQYTLEEFYCRPDFAYTDHQTLVFIDGPHHDSAPVMDLDSQKQRQLEEYGFLIVRFPEEQERWNSILSQYPDIFGTETDSDGVS